MARGGGQKQIGRPIPSGSFFDEHPVNFEGFVLRQHSIKPGSRPTLEQWAAALQFAVNVEQASPFWIGELWLYAENRQDWTKDEVLQKLGEAGIDLKVETLDNYASVVRNTSARARQIAPSIGHATAVMALEAPEQEKLLQEAVDENLKLRDFRLKVKASRRKKVIDGQAILEGQYRVILCDYPWSYSNRPPSGSGAEDSYRGMPISEGLKLASTIQAHAMPKAVGFFWVTAPMLYYATDPMLGPDPYRFIRECGFEPKTGMVWDKVDHVFGNYVSVRHEHLIIATRGGPLTPDRPTPQPNSVVREKKRQGAEHSEKPGVFHKVIERLYDGPYLELFGRKKVEGWTVFGNDARLWGTE